MRKGDAATGTWPQRDCIQAGIRGASVAGPHFKAPSRASSRNTAKPV
jgi:hypothetical protein